MKIRLVEDVQEFKKYFGFTEDGLLLETDLDIIENETELYERKRRDAETLCTIAANSTGKCLDIGTSHGRSAFKLATNIQNGLIYTVNLLPEQYSTPGTLPTHLLSKDEIGSFYRQYDLTNIEQIYANTLTWEIPEEISDLTMVFIDGDHDEDFVYADTQKLYDCVKDGGFILWHDFSPLQRERHHWINSVMRAVERFVHDRGLEQEIIYLKNSWIGVLRKGQAGHIPCITSPTRKSITVTPTSSPKTTAAMKSLRYIFVYPEYSSARAAEEKEMISRLRQWGYQADTFGIPCSGGWWPFPKLDEMWRLRSPDLMRAYEALAAQCRTGDILIASGGSMLHPEFIAQLPTYNIFTCADDPESSEILSRPVAPSFNFCFPTNIACTEMYRAWGCRNVEWIFHPIRPELSDPNMTEDQILNGERNLDIVMLCEADSGLSDRPQRIKRLMQIFPQACVRGRGWPGGPVAPNEYYRQAKIGWNLHHSVGPTNTRSTTLPAFGVMQICDNKQYLGALYELDKEIVGFDSIEECIDKTHYYLTHDQERRKIATRGWKRTMTDYTEERWWTKILTSVERDYATFKARKPLAAPQIQSNFDRQNGVTENTAIQQPPKLKRNNAATKPRLLLLADRRGWYFDSVALAVTRHLSDEFEFRTEYVAEQPDLNAWPFDLIYVFFWGETYHHRYAIDPRRVVKEIASHRWELEESYGKVSAPQMVKRYLADAGLVTTISKRLQHIFEPYREILLLPQGYESSQFYDKGERSGPLKIGWAGNINDQCKGVKDILLPAAGKDFELRLATGTLTHQEMAHFYNSIDVLCIASTGEGGPMPLIEAMACGCFPVSVDVGIVPELVTHNQNGLIIDRTIAAFRAAFQWCQLNKAQVREAGRMNGQQILRQRTWAETDHHWRKVLRRALQISSATALPLEEP